MKSLKESLFDDDLMSKDIELSKEQIFDMILNKINNELDKSKWDMDMTYQINTTIWLKKNFNINDENYQMYVIFTGFRDSFTIVKGIKMLPYLRIKKIGESGLPVSCNTDPHAVLRHIKYDLFKTGDVLKVVDIIIKLINDDKLFKEIKSLVIKYSKDKSTIIPGVVLDKLLYNMINDEKVK